jgi:hypothetical protein
MDTGGFPSAAVRLRFRIVCSTPCVKNSRSPSAFTAGPHFRRGLSGIHVDIGMNYAFPTEDKLHSFGTLDNLGAAAMYKHIAEAFVPVAHAQCVADQLCGRCCSYCLSIDAEGSDRLLTFEDCRAVLRPMDAGLQIRVEGRDMVVFCGVRMLLQSQLATVPTITTKAVRMAASGARAFRDFSAAIKDSRS